MGMTNQEAIKRIEEHIAIHKYRESHAMHIVDALDMAISALQAQDVPETNVGDMISRKAAIDALLHNQEIYSNNFGDDPIYRYTVAIIDNDVQAIANMPSAQPEIIRCKDCKWWSNDDYRECSSPNYDDGYVTPAGFYCGYAERRADESD